MLFYDERGLTLFRDLCVYIYTLVQCAVQTSSPHCTQKFVQNISKSSVIWSHTVQASLGLSAKRRAELFFLQMCQLYKARAVKTHWLKVKYLNKHQSPDLQHRSFLHRSCLQVISWYSPIHLIGRFIIQDNTRNNWQCESTIDVYARYRLKNNIRVTNDGELKREHVQVNAAKWRRKKFLYR